MPDKLDLLEQDIISLLEKHEPKMLRWNEIVETLWQKYQHRYKDRKGFGVAVTNKLRLLVAGKYVNRVDGSYGTPKSITPDTLSSIENDVKTDDELRTVKKALEGLQRNFRYFKEPTIFEVSCKVGKTPAIIEPILYMLANSTGWKPQENPEKEAQQAINLAGWLQWKEKNEQNPEMQALLNQEINRASEDTLRRAQMIAKNYPDLAPEVSLTDIVWPEKLKLRWTQVFSSEPPSPFWKTDNGFVSEKELRLRPAYRELFRQY